MKIGYKDVSSHFKCGFGAGNSQLGVFHVICPGTLVDSILLGKKFGFSFL